MNGIGHAEGIFFDNNTQKWYFGRVPFLGLIGGLSSAPSTHSPKLRPDGMVKTLRTGRISFMADF